MPEQEWAYLAPGPPLVRATTVEELAAAIERIEWPWGGSDDWRP